MSVGNGWDVIDVRRETNDDKGYSVTVYLRIPAELATVIEGGCSCEYCKAHPAEVPKWDALAVCDMVTDHSWTVHYPEAPRMTPAERVRVERWRATRQR